MGFKARPYKVILVRPVDDGQAPLWWPREPGGELAEVALKPSSTGRTCAGWTKIPDRSCAIQTKFVERLEIDFVDEIIDDVNFEFEFCVVDRV
jgi:hypothetical protein